MKKKCSERRKHCALAVVRRSHKFSPRRRPLPGGTGRPKFNQLEMVITFTYRPSLVRSMHAISSYCGNRPTNTNRQGRLQYTAPQLSAQCKQYIRKQYMPHTHYMTLYDSGMDREQTCDLLIVCPLPNATTITLLCSKYYTT